MLYDTGKQKVTDILKHHTDPLFKSQAVQDECQEQLDMWIYRLCGWWLALSNGKGTSQVATAIKRPISIVTMMQSGMGQDTGQQPASPPTPQYHM